MPLLTNNPRPTYRHLYGDLYQLEDKLRYMDNITGKIYSVTPGFVWDKGTVIKLLPRAIVPHGDEMTYPSAIHDKHYKKKTVSRGTADRVLRQFLIEEFDYARKMSGKKGKSYTGRMKAWTAWAAVRANLYAAYHW